MRLMVFFEYLFEALILQSISLMLRYVSTCYVGIIHLLFQLLVKRQYLMLPEMVMIHSIKCRVWLQVTICRICDYIIVSILMGRYNKTLKITKKITVPIRFLFATEESSNFIAVPKSISLINLISSLIMMFYGFISLIIIWKVPVHYVILMQKIYGIEKFVKYRKTFVLANYLILNYQLKKFFSLA